MTLFMKRTLPVLVCFLVGIFFLAQFYVPLEGSQAALSHGANTGKIVIAFSIVIGLHSLAHLHWTRIRRRGPGWGYSSLVFVGLIAMAVTGLAGEVQKFFALVLHADVPVGAFQEYAEDGTGKPYQWLFSYVYTPATETMFSLLAFFIASAAYRTFRARTLEAGLLLLAALIVVFGRVPIAAMFSDFFPAAADWVMAYPNMAVKRALLIGVSLGIVGTALRVIFGIERAYVGGD